MDKFYLENQVEKVLRYEASSFLNPIDTRYVINKVKKRLNYSVFKLYDEAEKLIVYTNNLDITLYEIITNTKITHQEILGTLFSHNLEQDSFGDIIIDNDKYYIVVLNKIKKYIESNFNSIGNKKIKLVKRDLNIVSNYKNKYYSINFNVSSLRIDSIISKLIPTSRVGAKEFIKDKKVIVNYTVLSNNNYMLKEDDIFSIRGIGKFKFIRIIGKNKKDKYVVEINKYI